MCICICICICMHRINFHFVNNLNKIKKTLYCVIIYYWFFFSRHALVIILSFFFFQFYFFHQILISYWTFYEKIGTIINYKLLEKFYLNKCVFLLSLCAFRHEQYLFIYKCVCVCARILSRYKINYK